MNNPFLDPGVAVYRDGEYIQRPTLFNRLVRHVEERAVYGAIYGLPRVGKTSLVFRLMEHFRNSEVLFVYIDLDAVSSESHFARFWYDARMELCRQLDMNNQESVCRDLSTERESFMDLVMAAKDRGRVVALVVDEFCTCLKHPPKEANEFIANFRSLISVVGGPKRNLRRHFCCLTLSRRRPEMIQSMTGGSTLAGTISERFQVGVFTPDEFEQQCAMVPGMTADQVRRLAELTHRHPYVSALVDKVLFSEKCSVDTAWDKVSKVVAGYYDDVNMLIAEATGKGAYVPEELKDYRNWGSQSADCVKETKLGGAASNSILTWEQCERQKRELIAYVQNGGRGIIYVHGERGSGKTHLVQQIAEAMNVQQTQVVLCSCSEWITPETAQHQLMGSMKGAFTDATDYAGVCERAHGGILFLDEICKLPLEAQNTLLKIIDDHTVRRNGGTKDIPTDFLFVCASWEDPASLIEGHSFSRDFKERIDMGKRVELLPLAAYRDRISSEDVDSVLSQVLSSEVEVNKQQLSFSSEARKQFLSILHSDERIDFKPNSDRNLPGNWRLVRKLIGEMVRQVIIRNADTITARDVEVAVNSCVGDNGVSGDKLARVEDEVIIGRLHELDKGLECEGWAIRAFCEFVRLAQEHSDQIVKHKGGYGKGNICREVYEHVPREDGKVPQGKTAPQQQFEDVLKNIGFANYEKARDWALNL